NTELFGQQTNQIQVSVTGSPRQIDQDPPYIWGARAEPVERRTDSPTQLTHQDPETEATEDEVAEEIAEVEDLPTEEQEDTVERNLDLDNTNLPNNQEQEDTAEGNSDSDNNQREFRFG